MQDEEFVVAGVVAIDICHDVKEEPRTSFHYIKDLRREACTAIVPTGCSFSFDLDLPSGRNHVASLAGHFSRGAALCLFVLEDEIHRLPCHMRNLSPHFRQERITSSARAR